MDKVLIAHGGWHQSNGQPVNGRDALMEVPEGLTICIYNVQGTPLSVVNGFKLLDLIRLNNMPTLQIGHNVLDDMNIEYKEFKSGTNSAYISDYSISGDDRIRTGLYNVGELYPVVLMGKRFRTRLSDIVSKHIDLSHGDVRLHLLCCQCFD